MPRLTIALTIALLTLGGVALACPPPGPDEGATAAPAGPDDGASAAPALPEVEVSTERFAAAPGAQVAIHEARLVGDVMTLEVSYTGGCAEHAFALIASPEPDAEGAQTVRLAHDDGGDRCKALRRETLRFTLAPLVEAARARGVGQERPDAVSLKLADHAPTLRLAVPADDAARRPTQQRRAVEDRPLGPPAP